MDVVDRRIWDELTTDLRDAHWEILNNPPLLAHYTSLKVVESILKNKQIWLSNPLISNDYHEVERVLEDVPSILFYTKACQSLDGSLKHQIMKSVIDPIFKLHTDFIINQLHGNFVISLCEHSVDDTDGVLSMWRGYGHDGYGAAIVFDSNKFNLFNLPYSLHISKIKYIDESEKYSFIENIMSKFINCIVSLKIPHEQYEDAAKILFHRLRLFAYFSKNKGFLEEREWRLVYFSDLDENHTFSSMKSYNIGPDGVDPILKLSLEDDTVFRSLAAHEMIDRIILGPAHTSPIRRQAVRTMLNELGYPSVRVEFSTIPYRPRR